MFIKYNFRQSRPDIAAGLITLIDPHAACTAIKWDTELRFYHHVFPNVLHHEETATFRAVNTDAHMLRLPAAAELPVIITREKDKTYEHHWGSIQIKGFWGGELRHFPKVAAKMNAAESYRAFIDDALSYYCKLGGMDHLASFYLLGSLYPGKKITVQAPPAQPPYILNRMQPLQNQ